MIVGATRQGDRGRGAVAVMLTAAIASVVASAAVAADATAPARDAQPGSHAPHAPRATRVSIRGDAFYINDRPTYAGRRWRGPRIEGLLFNARFVQGVFDDANAQTRAKWAYPDTGRWDADRNTREFVAAMQSWRRHGLLAFTLNLQGGCPHGYCTEQPWKNSAFTATGELDPAYAARLERILERADSLGMVVILGLFYFGQDQRLADEAAVCRAVDTIAAWLLDRDYGHVVIEINNECDIGYDHAILQPPRVHELIRRVQSARRGDRRLLVGTSFSGGKVPTENVVRASDFILLHGNGVGDPRQLADMVRRTRAVPGYRPMPILFNEDDHFDFDRPQNNLRAAIGEYASWGFFDPGENNYRDGYQCPPVEWRINTPRKRSFFEAIASITGAPSAASMPASQPACDAGVTTRPTVTTHPAATR